METDLFRLRFGQLDNKSRKAMYAKYKLEFEELPAEEIEERKAQLKDLPICMNYKTNGQLNTTGWYKVPFTKVTKLGLYF